MSPPFAEQLWEFARLRPDGAALPGQRSGAPTSGKARMPASALAALSLLPFRRLFAGARISSRIQEFVYTLS